MHEIIIPVAAAVGASGIGLWYNIYMVKKEKIITKKEVKKLAKVEAPTKGATFNKFGTCIECQNGDPNCKHNNLVQDGRILKCATCGKCF